MAFLQVEDNDVNGIPAVKLLKNCQVLYEHVKAGKAKVLLYCFIYYFYYDIIKKTCSTVH